MKGIKGLISVLLTVEAQSDALTMLNIKPDILENEMNFQTRERLQEEREAVAQKISEIEELLVELESESRGQVRG